MSAEETDKAGDGSGGDNEDEWLYRDDEKEDEKAPDGAMAPPADQDGGAVQEVVQEDDISESDSDDDDDDVCVTIGDIKTGGSSQYSAFGSTPVNLNIKTGGRIPTAVGVKAKGVDLDAPGSINGLPVLEVNLDSFEEKPWKKPGADISDYFNYGFYEDTWKAYCEKQRRLRGYYDCSDLSSSKIMVHQGRQGHGDKEAWLDHSPSGSLYRPSPRKSSHTINVIGGQTGCISRVEGRRRHNMEGNNIQVLSEPSSDAEATPTKISPFFPPNIPPPPFLPPPNVSSAPPLIPPPRFPLPPGTPPPSLIPSLDSGRSGGHPAPPPPFPFPPGGSAPPPFPFPPGGSAPPPFPFPPGVYPPMPGWAGVIDSAKAWEFYARQDRERERDQERERGREREREKDRERGREREREHSPASQVYNSEEERQRQRDYAERGADRRRSGPGRERDDRHRERRHRDKDEGRNKTPRSVSSSSSSKRRHDSEEGDSSRRHKHKKAKRSREDKDTNQEPLADQENQSEPTE